MSASSWRAGATKPDISSVDAFRRTLFNAKSIAFPKEGESGGYFIDLLARLGIADEMKPRLRPMPASDTVKIVARGEADMKSTKRWSNFSLRPSQGIEPG